MHFPSPLLPKKLSNISSAYHACLVKICTFQAILSLLLSSSIFLKTRSEVRNKNQRNFLIIWKRNLEFFIALSQDIKNFCCSFKKRINKKGKLWKSLGKIFSEADLFYQNSPVYSVIVRLLCWGTRSSTNIPGIFFFLMGKAQIYTKLDKLNMTCKWSSSTVEKSFKL